MIWEPDTTGALELIVAWLVFFVLGVDCSFSPSNPLSDTLHDNWLFTEEEWNKRRLSTSLFVLTSAIPMNRTSVGTWGRRLMPLMASSTGRSRSVTPMWVWSRITPWMWTSRSPMRTRSLTPLMRMVSMSQTPRSRVLDREYEYNLDREDEAPLASSGMWSRTSTTTWPMSYIRFSRWTASRNLTPWSRIITSVFRWGK